MHRTKLFDRIKIVITVACGVQAQGLGGAVITLSCPFQWFLFLILKVIEFSFFPCMPLAVITYRADAQVCPHRVLLRHCQRWTDKGFSNKNKNRFVACIWKVNLLGFTINTRAIKWRMRALFCDDALMAVNSQGLTSDRRLRAPQTYADD